MTSRFAHWKSQPSTEELLPFMERWYQSELGQYVLSVEQQFIAAELDNCFGYNLLQLSVDRDVQLYQGSRIQRHYQVHPLGDQRQHCQCEFDALSFEGDTFDVVIVHHAHEFVSNPHQLLREIRRVMVARGRLIIVGFNPWSLWGVYTALARYWPDSLWHNHLLSSRRLVDWLGLLEFSIDQLNYGGYCNLLQMRRAPRQTVKPYRSTDLKHRIPFGILYRISALKDVHGMTPHRPLWRGANPFAVIAPVKPAQSAVHELSNANHKESA